MDTPSSVTLMLAGDVMTGRGIDQVLRHPSAPGLHESYIRDARDYVRLAEAVNGPIPAPVSADYIWGDALAFIQQADPDLRIVNLETAVTTSEDAWPGKGIHYRMHPANVDCLIAARIDCCVLSNNHVLDWGQQGLNETLQVVRQAGLNTAGAGADGAEAWAPATLPLDQRGHLLVFACGTSSSGIPAGWSAAPKRSGVALLPDLSDATARLLAEDVARRREPGGVVLISIHWGGNWGLDLPPAHRNFAHRLVDLGAADIVHGHSSHHPLPIEVYRGKPIFYGCGDLINDYEGIGAHGSLRSDIGCLYFATLNLDNGRLQRIDIVPLQRKRFRLTAADASARRWLGRIFNIADCSLEPLQGTPKLRGWSLRWVDKG
jgi:poly-gamma-glutamate capsule biosynthesis protein CapA/YwtB (metallophosphatase superfamily)